jgi:phage terminase large subunit GpA-like protein
LQRLFWANVRWPKGEPLQAKYQCANCGEMWSDAKRWNSLQYGEWRAEHPEIIEYQGYHLWGAYSPWVKLGLMADKFLKVKNDPPRFKVFVNQDLGETWEEEGETIEAAAFLTRLEEYPAPVPAGGLVITAGVDVQKTWIEGTVKAWGIGQQSWLIDHFVLHGDPKRDPNIWQELDLKLSKIYEHEKGIKLKISAACIDSGHATTAVYRFCRGKENRRIFPIKGSSSEWDPIIAKFSIHRTYKVKLYIIGVNTAKDTIFSRLKIMDYGPGCMHFPAGTPLEYFEGLTAEKGIPTYKQGRPVTRYRKLRERNEPLDCEVYALAAIEILDPPFEMIARKLFEDDKPVEKKKKNRWVDSWKN